MRLALALGRLSSRGGAKGTPCLHTLPRLRWQLFEAPSRASASTFTSSAFARTTRSRGWRNHRKTTATLLAANGALAASAFIELSEKDNDGAEDTGEMRMLKVSRQEIKKEVDDDDRGFTRLRRQVVLFLDLYIWEPACTGVRFLQLAVIFVPVLLTVPVIWFGPRQRDRGNERAGTLWWYGFLVKAMEWAGPAFIKVGSALLWWAQTID